MNAWFIFSLVSTYIVETALVKIINNICINTATGKLTVLILLDFSAAFDTVNYSFPIG